MQKLVATKTLVRAASVSGRLARAWASHQQRKHPELSCVTNMMISELRLGRPWDPDRWEEVPPAWEGTHRTPPPSPRFEGLGYATRAGML